MIEETIPSETAPPTVTLKHLADIEQMSVRAYNVCNENGLRSLDAILAFYRQKGTFTKLRNAGRLTEEELVGICQKYSDAPPEIPEQIEPQTAPSVDWAALDQEQLAAVERHFQMRLAALSVRSRGVLQFIMPRIDTSARAYAEFFADPKHRQPNSFANAGRVTIAELLELQAELVQLARTIHEGLVEQVMFEQTATLWKSRFDLPDADVVRYRQDFVVRRFPLFRFLQDLFDRRICVSDRDMLLMRHRYNYFLGAEKRKFDDLGTELGVTRERVRQMTLGIPSKIRELVASVGPVADFVNYEALYSRNRDLIIVDEEFAECINTREGVSFVAPFYATVFESFLKASHDRVEEDFDAATDYLVHKDLTAVFDFDAYLRDLSERVAARIPETYTLDMKEHPKRFWSGEDYTHLPRVAAVCEVLAREEFGLDADMEGNPVFRRNTKRLLHEHMADILEEAKRPLHVEEILKILQERQPGLTSSVETIRSVALRYDRFSRFDASSTYGLKEWEEEFSHLKRGTFSDIAEEFLRESIAPQHLFDVADHVMQYRSTTRNSVIGTLKADTSDRFRWFDGGMIGLKSKDYVGSELNYRSLSGRVFDSLARLIRDNGNQVALSRLIDYCVLHYRMPEQQARTLFERAILDGRFELREGELVGVAEGD